MRGARKAMDVIADDDEISALRSIEPMGDGGPNYFVRSWAQIQHVFYVDSHVPLGRISSPFDHSSRLVRTVKMKQTAFAGIKKIKR
ncbi:hypothetical protein OPV22_014345 [Ensete ventricosum]|uniref:Uncharacterized protein n=1 Tax=Ensete ventricosum TaxID=4639 RepID=A0AAV8PJM7_ENSVE|nr:hypothetical protein OPV22_014345 [Ensete ventricosum]